MEYKIISASHFQKLSWSGGTIIQLFIFPLTADYSKRDFQFRLSTAKVEVDKSEFTSLPGFSRKLMVLDGEIDLIHENHHSASLKKFDIDSFEGDWKTSCIGKCTDFNLMTTGKTTGELNAIEINKGEFFTCEIGENPDWFFMYLYSGRLEINFNHEVFIILKCDLLIINKPSIKDLELKGIENSEIVVVGIKV